MMHNMNKDLIKYAEEQDLDLVRAAAEHGAWGDYENSVMCPLMLPVCVDIKCFARMETLLCTWQ